MSPRTMSFSYILCLSLLCLCLCLNTSINARPLQGFKHDSDDKGQPKLSISIGSQTMQEKYPKAKALGRWLDAGNNFALPPAKTKLETAHVTEYYKREDTRMLESTMEKAKESVDPKEEEMGEDTVVIMDYAQPHRKPPIHNMTP